MLQNALTGEPRFAVALKLIRLNTTIRQGVHSFSTSNLTFLMDKSPRVA
jgi:hypothetical protein